MGARNYMVYVCHVKQPDVEFMHDWQFASFQQTQGRHKARLRRGDRFRSLSMCHTLSDSMNNLAAVLRFLPIQTLRTGYINEWCEFDSAALDRYTIL